MASITRNKGPSFCSSTNIHIFNIGTTSVLTILWAKVWASSPTSSVRKLCLLRSISAYGLDPLLWRKCHRMSLSRFRRYSVHLFYRLFPSFHQTHAGKIRIYLRKRVGALAKRGGVTDLVRLGWKISNILLGRPENLRSGGAPWLLQFSVMGFIFVKKKIAKTRKICGYRVLRQLFPHAIPMRIVRFTYSWVLLVRLFERHYTLLRFARSRFQRCRSGTIAILQPKTM